jgi:hypothetical protein
VNAQPPISAEAKRITIPISDSAVRIPMGPFQSSIPKLADTHPSALEVAMEIALTTPLALEGTALARLAREFKSLET